MPSLKNLMGETFEPLGPALPKEVPQPEAPKWEPMTNHPGYERRGNEVRRADGPKELSLPLNLDVVDPEWLNGTPVIFDESSKNHRVSDEKVRKMFGEFVEEFGKIFPGDPDIMAERRIEGELVISRNGVAMERARLVESGEAVNSVYDPKRSRPKIRPRSLDQADPDDLLK